MKKLLAGVVAACTAAASLAAPAHSATVALLNAYDLVPVMRAGGTILLMRHERTEVPSRDDDYTKPGDCAVQRNLSPAGIAGSDETGFALKALDVPIGRVLASPMCRTMATARRAFGRVEADTRLMHHDTKGGRTVDIAGRDMRSVVEGLKPGSTNIVVISHYQNIAKGFDVQLAEGDIAVLKRDASGVYRVIGSAPGSDWGPAAREALSKAAKSK